MITPPSRGKPPWPDDDTQIQPGPLAKCPNFPDIAKADKRKFTAGKFAGRIMRVGKK